MGIETNLEVVKGLSFLNIVNLSSNATLQNPDMDFEDESEEYDLAKGTYIKDLNIQLGTANLPRFSCAAHKTNIAVRMAIKKHKPISRDLSMLSKYASNANKSVNQVQFHIFKKAKIKTNSDAIRWSAAFLMLQSFHSAYKKNAFDPSKPCPVSLDKIELYMQILLPAYQFSLIMQKNLASIADVLPSITIMISKWSRMEVQGEAKQLVNLLVSSIKFKFNDELNSHVYKVASLLNVSKLPLWYNRPDCEFIRKGAFERISEVVNSFTPNSSIQNSNNYGNTNAQNFNYYSNLSGEQDSLWGFMTDDNYVPESFVRSSQVQSLQVEKEKLSLVKLIEEKGLHSSSCPSYDFWLEYSNKMPILRKLFLILLNIPGSAAFIERYLSISGIVCQKRRGNMSEQLIINRSMLKANLKLLAE